MIPNSSTCKNSTINLWLSETSRALHLPAGASQAWGALVPKAEALNNSHRPETLTVKSSRGRTCRHHLSIQEEAEALQIWRNIF